MTTPDVVANPGESPRPGLARTIGLLNILVSLLLLLCGGGLAWGTIPFLIENTPFSLDPRITEDVVVELRNQTIADLRNREGSSSDPATKESLRKARERLAAYSPPLVAQVDFQAINRDVPSLGRYLWLDVATAPILNLALLVSGLALIALKEWGRRLALFVAIGKALRLVALSGYLVLGVVPALTRVMNALFRSEVIHAIAQQATAEAAAQQAAAGGAAPQLSPADLVSLAQAFGYGYAATVLAFGLIYPAVLLIVLTRPAVRAACHRGSIEQGVRVPDPARPEDQSTQ